MNTNFLRYRKCRRNGTAFYGGGWYCAQHNPATLIERQKQKLLRQEKKRKEIGKTILKSVVKEESSRTKMWADAMEHIKTAPEGSVYQLWVQVKMLFDSSCKFSIEDKYTEQQFELVRLALLDIKIEDIYDEEYTKNFLKEKKNENQP